MLDWVRAQQAKSSSLSKAGGAVPAGSSRSLAAEAARL